MNIEKMVNTMKNEGMDLIALNDRVFIVGRGKNQQLSSEIIKEIRANKDEIIQWMFKPKVITAQCLLDGKPATCISASGRHHDKQSLVNEVEYFWQDRVRGIK